MIRSLVLIAALTLSACAPTPDVQPQALTAPVSIPRDEPAFEVERGSRPTAAQTADCTARGGTYRQGGLGGYWLCITPYADGGKPCGDSDECHGDCLALREAGVSPVNPRKPGVCAADSYPFGCIARVEDGRVGGVLCAD